VELKDVLQALGTDRVIWIDDKFNKSRDQLATRLVERPELARKAGSDSVRVAIDNYEFAEGAGGLQELRQVLADMSVSEFEALNSAFVDSDDATGEMAAPELKDSVIADTCTLLGIKEEDRWTFADAMNRVETLCVTDSRVSYIIDLNETGGSDKRGLDVLKALHQYKSKGTAFLLTHSATANDEAGKEAELLEDMKKDGGLRAEAIPLCVVSKTRLEVAEGREGIAEALRIAMKRAGLRRSVHEVLQTVRADVTSAFEAAAVKLLEIPPEQLDEFVVGRAHHEGVSELHVVERAITAEVSQRVREMFAINEGVLASTARLRSLRAVDLGDAPVKAHPNLDEFRRMEVYESSELINNSYTPLACGDIFELDDYECGASARKQYLLLGQPCDISVRGEEDRDQEFAWLVPLVTKSGPVKSGDDNAKLRALQFTLDSKQLFCNFRDVASVRLSILDLASLRADGRVRFDADQPDNNALLTGMRNVIDKRVKASKKALDDGDNKVDALQLCFRSSAPFHAIARAAIKNKETKTIGEAKVKLPKRVTWSLKRTGRIRMPYASALLRDYLSLQGRDAFDLDFTKDRTAKPTVCAPAAAACG